jgi:hypothetical protein
MTTRMTSVSDTVLLMMAERIVDGVSSMSKDVLEGCIRRSVRVACFESPRSIQSRW